MGRAEREAGEQNTGSEKIHVSLLTLYSSPCLSVLPPLSLYIHIPWCVKKCPYCDFNSHESRSEIPEKQYVEALVADLESALSQISGRKIHSVFFGGGTPSVMSAETIDAILSAVRARLTLDACAEITLEANPGTFEVAKFAAFRAAGVNRLSIGIQSFNPGHLKALGRIHDDLEARRAVEIAQTHFDNINLDLMYALPGQKPGEALQDIKAAISYSPQHISAYHLTIEPNTLFHRYPPRLPDDELSAQMQAAIEEALADNGYGHYETSAFAREGFQSRHNLNYWRFGDYLGIGAGAHSKISTPQTIIRQMRYKQPQQYISRAIDGKSVQSQNIITTSDLVFEFMMNALRLIEGFPAGLFEERTGLPITAVQRELDEAERRGLIVCDHRNIAPTLRGQRFLNDLLQIFLPGE